MDHKLDQRSCSVARSIIWVAIWFDLDWICINLPVWTPNFGSNVYHSGHMNGGGEIRSCTLDCSLFLGSLGTTAPTQSVLSGLVCEGTSTTWDAIATCIVQSGLDIAKLLYRAHGTEDGVASCHGPPTVILFWYHEMVFTTKGLNFGAKTSCLINKYTTWFTLKKVFPYSIPR